MLNPVHAGLVERAEHWQWSSAAAHLAWEDDGVVTVAPALERYGRFADFPYGGADQEDAWSALRRAETSGRPVGSAAWVSSLEARTGRTLAPQKRGPRPRVSVI